MSPHTTTEQIAATYAQIASSDESLWASMPGLVWSNPRASNDARIAAALLNPRFSQLLTIAARFGTDRVQKVWTALIEESSEEVRRATPRVERILANIREGERLAHAGN